VFSRFEIAVKSDLEPRGRGSKEKVMNITNKTVLITGANRGIGRRFWTRRFDAERRRYMQERGVRCNILTNA